MKKLSNSVRQNIVEMTHRGNSSHIGSALSIVDILVVLYSKVLQINPKNPDWEKRDRFILSKGHAGAAVYSVLAEKNFFDKKTLETHCQDGSILSGHVSHKNVPGVEFSTGSLGHGLSVGVGMAYNAKLKQQKHRVFVLLGDGECNEGSIWEAVLFAAHHCLDNLIVIVDYNKIQSMGPVNKILKMEPFIDKWKAFGWNIKEVDGHNHDDLVKVFSDISIKKSNPSCVLAHTVKGKGISFMENKVEWHYKSPQGKEYIKAKKELNRNYERSIC